MHVTGRIGVGLSAESSLRIIFVISHGCIQEIFISLDFILALSWTLSWTYSALYLGLYLGRYLGLIWDLSWTYLGPNPK